MILLCHNMEEDMRIRGKALQESIQPKHIYKCTTNNQSWYGITGMVTSGIDLGNAIWEWWSSRIDSRTYER